MPITEISEEPFSESFRNLRELSKSDWAQRYIGYHAARCAFDVRYLNQQHPGSKVLNIGGAPYIFEAAAGATDLAVTTIDIDPGRHRAVVEALGIDIKSGDFEDPAFREALDLEPYDIICMCEIIEHFRLDLIGLLRSLKTRKRDDALLYITTPNFYFAPRFATFLRQGRSGPRPVDEWRKLEELGHMGHVREYSRVEMAELFEFVGFSIEDFFYRNSQPSHGFLGEASRKLDCLAQELVFVLR